MVSRVENGALVIEFDQTTAEGTASIEECRREQPDSVPKVARGLKGMEFLYNATITAIFLLIVLSFHDLMRATGFEGGALAFAWAMFLIPCAIVGKWQFSTRKNREWKCIITMRDEHADVRYKALRGVGQSVDGISPGVVSNYAETTNFLFFRGRAGRIVSVPKKAFSSTAHKEMFEGRLKEWLAKA